MHPHFPCSRHQGVGVSHSVSTRLQSPRALPSPSGKKTTSRQSRFMEQGLAAASPLSPTPGWQCSSRGWESIYESTDSKNLQLNRCHSQFPQSHSASFCYRPDSSSLEKVGKHLLRENKSDFLFFFFFARSKKYTSDDWKLYQKDFKMKFKANKNGLGVNICIIQRLFLLGKGSPQNSSKW